MATAYTPGPLTASPADFPVKYFIRDEEGKAAGVANTKEDGELWAAAPRLLEVLKEAYARFSAFGNNWEGRETTEGQWLLANMFHTIQKAEGKQ